MWNSVALGDVNSISVESLTRAKGSFGNSVAIGDVTSNCCEERSPRVEDGGAAGDCPKLKVVARGERRPNESSISPWFNPVMWNSVDLGDIGS